MGQAPRKMGPSGCVYLERAADARKVNALRRSASRKVASARFSAARIRRFLAGTKSSYPSKWSQP